MSRIPIAAANWKMHKTAAEARELVAAIVAGAPPRNAYRIVMAPPFTALAAAVDAASDADGIAIAGQNCHWESQGAFTGEIAPAMLADVGCTCAIVGHSERRQYFGETDETVAQRTKAALAAGLNVIVCIGETETERDAGATEAVLTRQLTGGVGQLSADDWGNTVIAYEPVWAIGTGKTATPEMANDAHVCIRDWLSVTQGQDIAASTRILYGGSMKPENTAGLISQPDIDGGLIGGASLQPESFLDICRTIAAEAS